MDLQNPHDKFFKESLSDIEVAKDFIANYLPASILEAVDVNTLEVQKDSFINEELQEYFSDLLFKVGITNEEGYLYLLFEHKSFVDQGIALQLLKYMVEIWQAKRNKEHAKQLPLIIPLVIYHGKSNWNISTSFSGSMIGYHELPQEIKAYIPDFEFLLYDISRYSDDDIKGSAKTRIIFTLLRDVVTKTGKELLESILRALYYWKQIDNQETAVGYLETMFRYIFSVAKDLKEDDIEEVVKALETTEMKGSDFVTTLADKWRREGMERGIRLGTAKSISQLLTAKFGDLPKELHEELNKLDLPTLENILEHVFDFEKIDDVKKFFH